MPAGACRRDGVFMQGMRHRAIVKLVTGMALSALTALADDAAWDDTFYQYRIPVVIDVEAPGWQRVPVTEQAITDAINGLGPFRFDPAFFAWNAVKVVEVDDAGAARGPVPEAGFYLVPKGEELAVDLLTNFRIRIKSGEAA